MPATQLTSSDYATKFIVNHKIEKKNTKRNPTIIFFYSYALAIARSIWHVVGI